jgi:hypothetical protein
MPTWPLLLPLLACFHVLHLWAVAHEAEIVGLRGNVDITNYRIEAG